jgi:DNA-binding SARP family transcriptional activator/predicted ATPase
VTSLQFYLLGSLVLRSGGQPLRLPPTSKSQSLLAFLALHRNMPQRRERLIDMYWGERPERSGRRSLSTALWHIRRCLPDTSILVSDAHAVHLDGHADLWLDAGEFEALVSSADPAALESALDLYRGDLLEGFYDDWILGERYRLEALFLEALARLMVYYESAGNHQAALARAKRLLARDPLREDAHRLAMRAYCRLGQRHAALEQYHRCQQALLAGLGAELAGETTALHASILSGVFQAGPASIVLRDEVRPLVHAGHNPLDVLAPIRLVGRERELVLLQDAWQQARNGESEIVLVSGEVGVGKTRLVAEFADGLRWQGVRVLSGRCYEFERVLPYQPFAEALHAALPALSQEELAACPAWALDAVTHLVPELQDRITQSAGASPARRQLHGTRPGGLRPPASDLQLDQKLSRIFEGVCHVLAVLSSWTPLLILLDDLHWAGESTLGLLHHLARHLAEQPVLIVGTFRPEAAFGDHPLRALWRRLARDGLVRPLRLVPLTPEAVETMIVEMSGVGRAVVPLAGRLYRETEGNPFFLMELVKALFEMGALRLEEGAWNGDFCRISTGTLPLPPGVSEAIQARVARLESGAQQVLALSAVLGREFDFELLSAAWGRGEEATLEALDSLLRGRLVEEGALPGARDFAFTHHKIQEVIYDALPRPRRLHWHRRVGKAMEALHVAELEARAGELAHHFERACSAGGPACAKAVAYLLRAGQHSARHSAHQDAIAYYRRGLDLLHSLPEGASCRDQEINLQLALSLATAVVHGYAARETWRAYDRARELCQDHGESAQASALFTSLVGLARFYGVRGDVEAGLEIASQLLTIARASEDTVLSVEACRQMGGMLFSLGRLQEAQGYWEEALALYDSAQHEVHAHRFGHDPAATCLSYSILTLWLLGYPERAQAHSQVLHDLALSMTHPSSRAYAYCFLATQANLSHDVAAAQDQAETAIELGDRHELASWTAMATVLQGWALVQKGQCEEGLAQLRSGTATWRARGFAHLSPIFLGFQAEACLRRGLLEEGAAALSAACAIAERGDRYWLAEVWRLQGELARAEGRDGPDVEAHFLRAMGMARQQEAKMLELRAATSLAWFWRDLGRAQEARQVLAHVIDRFDEGLDSCELQQAAALLRTMA